MHGVLVAVFNSMVKVRYEQNLQYVNVWQCDSWILLKTRCTRVMAGSLWWGASMQDSSEDKTQWLTLACRFNSYCRTALAMQRDLVDCLTALEMQRAILFGLKPINSLHVSYLCSYYTVTFKCMSHPAVFVRLIWQHLKLSFLYVEPLL